MRKQAVRASPRYPLDGRGNEAEPEPEPEPEPVPAEPEQWQLEPAEAAAAAAQQANAPELPVRDGADASNAASSPEPAAAVVAAPSPVAGAAGAGAGAGAAGEDDSYPFLVHGVLHSVARAPRGHRPPPPPRDVPPSPVAAAPAPSAPTPPPRWSREAVQLLTGKSGPGAPVDASPLFDSMKGATLTTVASSLHLHDPTLSPADSPTGIADDDCGNTRLFLIGGQLADAAASDGGTGSGGGSGAPAPDRIKVFVCNMNDALSAAGSEDAWTRALREADPSGNTTAALSAAARTAADDAPSSLWQELECTGDVPRARFGHTATFVPPASIFVMGGFAASGPPIRPPPAPAAASASAPASGARAPLRAQVTYSDAFLLDCNTLVWTKVAPSPTEQQQRQQAHTLTTPVLKSLNPGRRAFHSAVYFLNDRRVDSDALATRLAAPITPSPNFAALVTDLPEPVPEIIVFGGCRTSDATRAAAATRMAAAAGDAAAGEDAEEDDGDGGCPLQFLDDLYVLNLRTLRWRMHHQRFGVRPGARAQHTAAIVTQSPPRGSLSSLGPSSNGSRMLVYSGCNESHLLCDLYSLDLWTYAWSAVRTFGAEVPRRQITDVHALQDLPSAGSDSRAWVR